MRAPAFVAILVAVGCGAGASAPPQVRVAPASSASPGTVPASPKEIVLDVDAGGAPRAAPIFARRLEAAGLRVEVSARGPNELAVRVLAGDPDLVARLARAGEVLLAPLDDGFDLVAAADLPPPKSAELLPERVRHPDGSRGSYLACPASDARELSAWLAHTHVPEDRFALVGDEDEPDPRPRVRTFVVLRDAVISSADVHEATAGADDAGSFVSVRIGDEASHRLEEYTRAHVQERLAFVAAGRVVMAPRIVSPIATRELRIGLGVVPDASERARRLAEALTAGAIPSPLRLRPGGR
jgi:hypothetical protein